MKILLFIGFLRGACPRGGGNWGTLRVPREDWGRLGESPPGTLKNPIIYLVIFYIGKYLGSSSSNLFFFVKIYIRFGCGPLRVTVTTRGIMFLVGDPYKPSFATVTRKGPPPMEDDVPWDKNHHQITHHPWIHFWARSRCKTSTKT